MSAQLILLRHGESVFNLENKFTGLIDVELSENGIKEAQKAALMMNNYSVDTVFTSNLKRAIKTADIVVALKNIKHRFSSDALNERDYGDFSGHNKDEIKNLFGEEKFFQVRRGFYEKPPKGESLKDVYERVVAYFKQNILMRLKEGENVLIVAHGNSLRALIKYLENISDEKIASIELKTGVLQIYNFDNAKEVFTKENNN